MPKTKKNIESLKHPNSRKTLSLVKQIKKQEKREKIKVGTHIKLNLLGEKIMWFKERIPDECRVLSNQQTLELIETYLARFDDELEAIASKKTLGKRINHQHAAREDVINITKKREIEEFDTCGLEMPNLMDPEQMSVLKKWNGELRFIQHFKLKRIARKHLK